MNGPLLLPLDQAEQLAARLERSIDRSAGEDACHPFTDALDQSGYGKLKWNGVLWKAHRAVAVAARKVAVDSRTAVLHHCDNPACCNERHFFYGTQTDNMADRDAKLRTKPGGLAHREWKLDADKAAAIRIEYASGKSLRAVGQLFGVSKDTIREVVIGKTWAAKEAA